MPAAVIVPIALALGSMVASNVQQKAALKNNQNQQAQAVKNAKQAWGTAQQQMAPNTQSVNYSGLNGPVAPKPTIGLAPPNVPAPTTPAQQPQGQPSSASILSMLQNPQAAQQNPQVAAMLNQILGQGQV